jgi:hypothetical protein
MKCQCSICGSLKPREEVEIYEHDVRTYMYKCINCDKEPVPDLKDWISRFPGAEKKLNKFLQDNPMPQ